jgi:hypothetical protein
MRAPENQIKQREPMPSFCAWRVSTETNHLVGRPSHHCAIRAELSAIAWMRVACCARVYIRRFPDRRVARLSEGRNRRCDRILCQTKLTEHPDTKSCSQGWQPTFDIDWDESGRRRDRKLCPLMQGSGGREAKGGWWWLKSTIGNKTNQKQDYPDIKEDHTRKEPTSGWRREGAMVCNDRCVLAVSRKCG